VLLFAHTFIASDYERDVFQTGILGILIGVGWRPFTVSHYCLGVLSALCFFGSCILTCPHALMYAP
jgi:hypothetical protein